MSTQRYHYLAVIGRAARDLEAACDALLARRVPDHPRGVGGTDYGPRDHRRVEQLCLALLDHADDLPVLHHATEIDGYAMGNHVLGALPWPDGRGRALLGLNYGLAVYPSRFTPGLLRSITTARRRLAARRRPGAVPSYEANVAMAIAAARVFGHDYTVAVVAECLGPSRLDADVHASAAAPLPGVFPRHPRRPRHGDPAKTDELGARFIVPLPKPAKRASQPRRGDSM